MLLAVDIGNTSINFGILNGKQVCVTYKVETRLNSGALKREIKKVLAKRDRHAFEAVVVCSVVPRVSKIVETLIRKEYGKKPFVVGREMTVPMKNLYKNPRQVGQDRLVVAYAASRLYGTPVIVIDLGTAITLDVVSKKQEYLGGIIIPGLRLSSEALFEKTALLPRAEIDRPASLIGRDTKASILSGLFYGYGEMLSGLIGLLKKKVKTTPKVIMTGGYARIMDKFIIREKKVVDPHLIFKGLYLVWEGRK